MAAILRIDESAGNQNLLGSLIVNDTSATLPTRFSTALAPENTAGQPILQAGLSGVDGTAARAGGTPVLTLAGSVLDVGFTDAAGNPLNGADSGLVTPGGARVLLYTSTRDNNLVVGRAEGSGALVFAAFLDTGITSANGGDTGATAARLWITQHAAIGHGDATNPNDLETLSGALHVSTLVAQNFSVAGAPSGQNLFLMFSDGQPGPDDVAVVVTGEHPADNGAGLASGDTVNTGQGGGTTTIGSNNQMVDPGEAMYFSFVRGPASGSTVPNLDQTEADLEANISFASFQSARGASFSVVQLQSGKMATLTVSALRNTDNAEKGTDYLEGLGDADDLPVNVDSITVTRQVKVGKVLVTVNYVFSEAGNPAQGGVSVSFTGDTARITGLKASDRIAYTTSGDHNRVLIDNVGNADASYNAAFDIGGFQVATGSSSTRALGDIDFVDDAPTAGGSPVTGTVDEDGLPGGLAGGTGDVTVPNVDGDANEATTTGSVATLFSGGRDGLAGYALSSDAARIALLPSLTARGETVRYAVAGHTLNAFVEAGGGAGYQAGLDRDIFSLSLDATTGAYAFRLRGALDHPTAGTEDSLGLQLGAIVQATDGDGDRATASASQLVVSVNDDSPLQLAPGDLRANNVAGAVASAALGAIGRSGADTPASVAFVGTNGSVLRGIVQDGTPATANLQANGADIYLFGFGTTVLTATTDPTNTNSAARVFTMTLSPDSTVASNDVFTLQMIRNIANTQDVDFGTLTVRVASGNPAFKLVENIGGTKVDALFSGYENLGTLSTVNVSAAGVGVGSGQDFNYRDRMQVQFLQDDGAGNATVTATEAQVVNRFTFVTNQNNPPADDGDLLVRAFDKAGNEVAITGILVNKDQAGGGALVANGVINTSGIASNDGGRVTAEDDAASQGIILHGLGGGSGGSTADNDYVTVITANGYARLDITGLGQDTPKDTFDILLQSVALPVVYDLDFNVQARLVDRDGDASAPATLDVHLVGVAPV